MREFMFIIDGQPMSKKRNYKIIRLGGRYTLGLTKQYKAWEKSAKDQLWVQRMQYQASMIGPWEPIAEPVEVTFLFYMKDKKRYDMSNLIQGAEDALVDARILKDDSQIQSYDGSRKWLDRSRRPQVLITIRPWPVIDK